MSQYSIKEIENITGIKAHTIRIWEKRYNIVEPRRTDTNIRYYTDGDLKKLLTISTLNNHGIKISHLAMMTDDQLQEEILELSRTTSDAAIETLKLAMVEYDEKLFNNLFDELVEDHGLEKAVTETIYPFFEEVGILWLSGSVSPAQEHFISNLIRQKLFIILSNTPVTKKEKVVSFLLEGEWHELGLLFYSTLLKIQGYDVIYLGQSCPARDVSSTLEQLQPKYAMTSLISTDRVEPFAKEINSLANTHSDIHFIISGKTSEQLDWKKMPKNTQNITNSNKLKQI